MRKRNMNKKFSLNKQTVANLTASDQLQVRAGDGERCELTECKSNTAYYYSSSAYIINTVVIPATEIDPRLLPCKVLPGTDTR